MFYISIFSFVKIWLGEKYLISNIAVLLFASILFVKCIYSPISTMISVAGKFKETKVATIVAAIFNVLLSILLVGKYQISGVLFATVFSELFIMMPFYVKCIYKDVLNENRLNYYKKFIYSLLLVIALVLLDKFLIKTLSLYLVSSYLNWFISSAILGIIDAVLIFLILFFTMQSFKALVLRFKNMIKKENKFLKIILVSKGDNKKLL